MELEILNSLIQFPIVGVIVWLVWSQNKRWDSNTSQWLKTVKEEQEMWRNFLKERNGKTETAWKGLESSLDKLSSKIDTHNKENK